MQSFETQSVRMERQLLVTVRTPAEDVERIMAEVTRITPLPMGKNYDSNAFEAAAGVERYRPLQGAAAGPESETRRRPGVVDVSFEIPEDQSLLEALVEAIFLVHSYQEPVILVQPVLSARSKGLDDSKNPNRWWNREGDWKKKG